MKARRLRAKQRKIWLKGELALIDEKQRPLRDALAVLDKERRELLRLHWMIPL